MKNRYGKEYWFEKVSETTYRFHMEEGADEWMRFGVQNGQTELDETDLGYFDPSGGPFVSIGYKVDNKPITRISSTKEGIFVEVKND